MPTLITLKLQPSYFSYLPLLHRPNSPALVFSPHNLSPFKYYIITYYAYFWFLLLKDTIHKVGIFFLSILFTDLKQLEQDLTHSRNPKNIYEIKQVNRANGKDLTEVHNTQKAQQYLYSSNGTRLIPMIDLHTLHCLHWPCSTLPPPPSLPSARIYSKVLMQAAKRQQMLVLEPKGIVKTFVVCLVPTLFGLG